MALLRMLAHTHPAQAPIGAITNRPPSTNGAEEAELGEAVDSAPIAKNNSAERHERMTQSAMRPARPAGRKRRR